jgi:chromosome segregation ATPase
MDDTPNDMARHDAPVRDTPRQPVPLDPAHFTMTVDDASARFAEAGLPRSVRSIQRYCQRGHLTCTSVDTEISEMYLIDPDSVERRIRELQQIEFVTRAPGVSRQEVAPEKIEAYERRIKELEEKAMHLEIDKRAREQIINMLKEDRDTLFKQVSNHVRTITDQARVIGQLETRLELGPGRAAEEMPRAREAEAEYAPQAPQRDAPPAAEPRATGPVYETVREERQEAPYRPQEPVRREEPTVEYPPRYGAYSAPGQGDNRAA